MIVCLLWSECTDWCVNQYMFIGACPTTRFLLVNLLTWSLSVLWSFELILGGMLGLDHSVILQACFYVGLIFWALGDRIMIIKIGKDLLNFEKFIEWVVIESLNRLKTLQNNSKWTENEHWLFRIIFKQVEN